MSVINHRSDTICLAVNLESLPCDRWLSALRIPPTTSSGAELKVRVPEALTSPALPVGRKQPRASTQQLKATQGRLRSTSCNSSFDQPRPPPSPSRFPRPSLLPSFISTILSTSGLVHLPLATRTPPSHPNSAACQSPARHPGPASFPFVCVARLSQPSTPEHGFLLRPAYLESRGHRLLDHISAS